MITVQTSMCLCVCMCGEEKEGRKELNFSSNDYVLRTYFVSERFVRHSRMDMQKNRNNNWNKNVFKILRNTKIANDLFSLNKQMKTDDENGKNCA